ncbi:MAG: four helix bundle protein [Bacteroidota bacterium]
MEAKNEGHNYSDNLIVNLSFKFALNIITFAEVLEGKRKFVLANQLLKSGTSIGANIREAQGAESKADFVHKMKIAYKEANETEYWLLLCKYSDNYPESEDLLAQNNSIQKVLGKIISQSKK